MLWGAFALTMAFNGYTMDTSHVGPGGQMGYAVTAQMDSDGNYIPITDEQTEAAAAEYKVGYDANIKSHKIRGGMLLGGGIVALLAGLVLVKKSRSVSKRK